MLETLLSGTITGFVGGIVGKVFDYKSKKLELQMKQQEFQNNIELAKISASAAVNVEDSKAFRAAIMSEPEKYYEGVTYSNKQRWLMIALDFLRGIVRPALTLYLCALTTLIYFKAERLLQGEFLSTDLAFSLVSEIIQTVLFLTVTAIGFWFGSRNNFNTKK